MYVGIYFILYLVRIDKTARRDVTVCGASANFKQNTRGAEHGGAEDGSDRSFVTVHTYYIRRVLRMTYFLLRTFLYFYLD